MSLGLGVIGCGSVFAGPYRAMIGQLRAAGRVHVSAVYDIDPVRRHGAAAHYDVDRDLRGPEDVIEAADVVLVLTSMNEHGPLATAALEAGRHVLVEKPMAPTLAEADAMVAAARAAGAWLMVAHCWRFHPDVRALRARVEAGELGEVVKTRSYGVHAGWGPSGWFTDPELAGGGALQDMGVHAIDTTRYLLGDPRPVRVCAVVGTRYGGYGVDDDAVLLVTWSNDTNSVVESGWWQPHLGGLEADTELYGTGGYARVWEMTEPPPGYEHCTQPMYSAQLAEFVEAVAAGRQPRPSGEDGRVVVQVVEQAYASARGRAG
jgi:predicted dehydrogenase